MLEFKRTLYKDKELPFLWHYLPEQVAGTKKPILLPQTPNFKTINPEILFENHAENKCDKKLVLEIGSGKGDFLCDYAQKFQQNYIIGAEWDLYCAKSTIKKIEKFKIKNAAVMRGDLFYFLKDLMPSNSIDEVHTYFPDPWPKKKHQKNRLILREGFLEQLCRVFKQGKRLFYWATDHEEYNKLVLEKFENFPLAKVLEKNIANPTYCIETGFEKKYKKEGRKIYRSIIELSIPSVSAVSADGKE